MLVTLDYESFYGTGYGLRTHTTEEYIRDPRFQVIGFSLKIDDGPTEWFTGSDDYMGRVLREVDWSRAAMAAHNCRFDASILNWRFGLTPRRYLDTLSMARGLVGLRTRLSLEKLAEYFNLSRRKGDEVVRAFNMRREDFTPEQMHAYGQYAITDTELCYELLMRLLPHTLPSELKLIDWTIRAYAEPKLVLDYPVLEQELRDFHSRRGALLARVGLLDVSQLRSDDMMAKLLQDLGVDPPTKWSEKQKKTVWAFSKQDVEFMDLLDDEDEDVVALVEARIGAKTSILQSRVERLIGISRRGPLPVPLAYAGAMQTRRWAGDDKLNVQNLPRSTKARVSPLRAAICAPPGKRMAAADLSQIELRVNCWQSGQHDTLAVLRGGGDVYSVMAGSIFGFDVNKDQHPVERFVGKTTELGCGYQCGGDKFHHMLKTDSRKYGVHLPDNSPEFAHNVVRTYRASKKNVVGFWYKAQEALQYLAAGMTAELGPYRIRDYKIYLPDGESWLYYPDLKQGPKSDPNEIGVEWTYQRMFNGTLVRSKIYGGKFVENLTQATARLFVSEALLRLDGLRYADGRRIFDVVLSVHDELVVLFDEGLDEQWVHDTLRWAMTTPPGWAPHIPLDCEIGIGSNYGEIK